eukprot:SAG31_NODE_1780_length_7290_cov_1.784036_2_plen_280_part_00
MAIRDGLKLTAAVNCAAEHQNPFEFEVEDGKSQVNYLELRWQDDESQRLLVHLPGVCCWLDQQRVSGNRVLIFCNLGRSRSSAVSIAYMLWKQHANSRFGSVQTASAHRKQARKPASNVVSGAAQLVGAVRPSSVVEIDVTANKIEPLIRKIFVDEAERKRWRPVLHQHAHSAFTPQDLVLPNQKNDTDNNAAAQQYSKLATLDRLVHLGAIKLTADARKSRHVLALTEGERGWQPAPQTNPPELEDAIAQLKVARPGARLNSNFLRELRRWAIILRDL